MTSWLQSDRYFAGAKLTLPGQQRVTTSGIRTASGCLHSRVLAAQPRTPGSASATVCAPAWPRSTPASHPARPARADPRWLLTAFVTNSVASDRRTRTTFRYGNQLAADRLDRLPLNEICPPDLRDRPPKTSIPIQPHSASGTIGNPIARGGPFWTPITPQTGSFFHAESHGPFHICVRAKIARRITPD